MRHSCLVALLSFAAMSAEALATPQKAETIQDCPSCPEMVALPDGKFVLGSPPSEPGRYANEGPQRRIRVEAFAIGQTEVTRRQFAEFVADTKWDLGGGCYTPGNLEDLLSDLEPTASLQMPGFGQTSEHPVVCVSWNDARAYAEWLSAKTGHRYRLPTEIEWEYAARSGTSSAYYWGDSGNAECAHVNGGDLTLGDELPLWAQRTREAFQQGERNSMLIPCRDGSAFTSAAGRYAPNAFGLYDMAGNVWEWVEDCGDAPNYSAPNSHGADCQRRRTRGGSWDDWPVDLRSAVRKRLNPAWRRNDTGFRLVRENDPDTR